MSQQRTILVVDDDAELSDGLKLLLERQGYKVLQAQTADRLAKWLIVFGPTS